MSRKTAAQEAAEHLARFARIREAADPSRDFAVHFESVSKSREPLFRALGWAAVHPIAMRASVAEFRQWIGRNLDRVPPEVRAVWGPE